jgi:tetratricopeptide (TPR) repeat protein
VTTIVRLLRPLRARALRPACLGIQVLALALIALLPAAAMAKPAPHPLPPGLAALGDADGSAAEQMARDFAKAITEADAEGVQRLIDLDGLAWSIASAPPPVEVRMDESVRGMLATMGSRFAAQVPGGTRATSRGLVERSGETRALIRLLMGQQESLNYIELRMGKRPDGRIVAFDWYDHYQGRYAARGMRDGLATSIESLLVSEYGFEKSQLTESNMASMQQLIFEALNGNFALCLEAYGKLPEDVRKLRGVMLARQRAAMQLGSEEALIASLADLDARYGDDPELQLIVNDYGFLTRDKEKALASVERLLKILKQDAAIYEMKALVYQGESDVAEARKALHAAIQNDPDMMSPYWTLIDIDAQREDYTSVIATFDTLESRFGIELDPEALAAAPNFAGLASSDVFAKWRAAKAPAPSEAPDAPLGKPGQPVMAE